MEHKHSVGFEKKARNKAPKVNECSMKFDFESHLECSSNHKILNSKTFLLGIVLENDPDECLTSSW